LPSWNDVYSPFSGSFYILRTVTFLKTEREREIGIGDDYNQPEIPFGDCRLLNNHHAWPGETILFQFNFDYAYLAEHYNRVAREQNR